MNPRTNRDPADLAEYDQYKANTHSEIDRMIDKARTLAAEGHDEPCIVGYFYGSLMRKEPKNRHLHNVVSMLAFAAVREADLPNKTQTGCVH